MKVFISYSQADRDWAEKLKTDLGQQNISAWLDQDEIAIGDDWRQKIQQAIESAKAFVLVIGPRSEFSDWQRYGCQAAIEACWADPNKRLIPFLLRNAQPPDFVRGAENVLVLRVSDPQRRWPHAVQDLLTVLHGQEDLSRYKQLPAWTEEDTKHYHERLEEIGNWAESLREEMDTPKTRAPSSDA